MHFSSGASLHLYIYILLYAVHLFCSSICSGLQTDWNARGKSRLTESRQTTHHALLLLLLCPYLNSANTQSFSLIWVPEKCVCPLQSYEISPGVFSLRTGHDLSGDPLHYTCHSSSISARMWIKLVDQTECLYLFICLTPWLHLLCSCIKRINQLISSVNYHIDWNSQIYPLVE